MNESSLRLSAGGRTEVGRRFDGMSWSRNDDYLLIDAGLFLVLDGGGNWEGPDQRARRGAEVIQQVVREGIATTTPRDLIERAFRAAGETLLSELDEYGGHGVATVVLLLFASDQVHVSWLGGSMAYRVVGNSIEAIIRPHTFWEELSRRGQLTQEGAQKMSPGLKGVLIQYLGTTSFDEAFEVISITPKVGDRFILTTDGAHASLVDSQFIAACQTHPEPQACANRLIELARENGSRDNCTCVVIAFE